MMKVRLLTLYIICLTCNLLTAQTVQWSVKPTYSSLEEYVGKLYKYRENEKVGLVDISGKVLVEAKYDSITPFIDYHALALDFQGGNFMLKGIINQYNLKLVEVPNGCFPSKDYPFFSEGKLVVYNTARKYGYLLPDGSFFKHCEYTEAFPFYHGRALIYKNRTTAEYLKDDGNTLDTQLEVEEYCTLLPGYCSAFNEDGLALIKGKSNYGSAKDMVVDIWGKKVNGVKLKNFKERTSFYTESSSQLTSPLESHVFPVERNGLFGFQEEGKDALCVPVQFEEAYPFKDGYARVKLKDKYGILKLISNASFQGKLLQEEVEVLNGKHDSLIYLLELPQQLQEVDWNLKMETQLGLAQSYSLKKSMGGKVLITFKPDLKNKEQEKIYKLSLYADDLLLWDNSRAVTFKYVYRNNFTVSVPTVAENYNSDADGCFWADEYRKLEVFSLIENKSDEDIWLQVIMGARDRGTQKDLSVKKERIKLGANSMYKFSLNIENINKECDLDIYIQLPDNGRKENRIIKVKTDY